MRIFGGRVFHCAAPQNLAVQPIQADERAFLFLLQRLGEENLFTPNHRRAVAAIGQGNFPRNVFRGAPFEREIFFVADADSAGSAPHGPVFGLEGKGGRQGNEQIFHGRMIALDGGLSMAFMCGRLALDRKSIELIQ